MNLIYKYLSEGKKEVNEAKLMHELHLWSMHNKKFNTFNKLYNDHFSYFRNMKEYVAQGGRAWGQKWSDIVGQHITDQGDDYWYQKKKTWKFWDAFSKKVKISLEDLEKFANKWNRTIY